MPSYKELEQAIVHLETQRAALGDAVVDVAVAALRQQLAGAALPGGWALHRQAVIVLSADFAGFTAWSEARDAEEVTWQVNEIWTRLDQIVVVHGGVVDIHLGDGLVALWGVPQAREDDAERAVRAALVMQEEFGTLTAGWDGPPLHMRIGIVAGSVQLGGGKAGSYAAGGDAVLDAMEVQGAAPPGAVLISCGLACRLDGAFAVVPYEPAAIRPELLPVYLATAASALELPVAASTWMGRRSAAP